MTRLRYGASPLHLLAHVGAFALAGWAIAQVFEAGAAVNFVAWFTGAALLHDLVLLPLYSVVDRGALAAARVTNYVRVPAAISGLLLLIYFPSILGLSDRNYFAATGHHEHGYARNWALITASLFIGSGLVWAFRRRRRL